MWHFPQAYLQVSRTIYMLLLVALKISDKKNIRKEETTGFFYPVIMGKGAVIFSIFCDLEIAEWKKIIVTMAALEFHNDIFTK